MILFLLLLSLFPLLIDSKLVQGHLWTGDNWKFLARFCFLSLHGKFEYEIRYEASFKIQNIDLYYDAESQWDRVYGSHSDAFTCEEKESVLQISNNQFINLTTTMIISGCRYTSLNNDTFIHCKGTRNFNTARERWWFVAVSNCKSKKGLKMSYKFLMTNGKKGDLLHYHFSADEFYILPIIIVAMILNTILFILTIWSALVLKTRQLFHTTFKMYLMSVFLHTLGLIFLVSHYLSYGLDGQGFPQSKLFGRMLESSAEVLFIILLILLGKGYTVTRARLRPGSAMKVTLFACTYGITYVVLFIIENHYFDPGQVLYLYESIAGYGLVILRLVGWLMFIYSVCFTLKHYPEKGAFYYPFFGFYTLWFLAGPIIIIISNHVISDWVREKVVISVEHFVVFIGQTFFLHLTRPSVHNENFPYHVRTSQIGIMEALSGNATVGQNTLDNFSHGGAYGINRTNNMDVFTVHRPTNNEAVPWSAEINGNAVKVYDPNFHDNEEDNNVAL